MIFMIINGLLTNLIRTVSCFQYDSLWKSLKIVSIPDRTHDVYDRKGVSLKRGKAALLFSIGYTQQNEGNCARCSVEPTMCMMGKSLEAERLRSVISYVIENKSRSSLAPKMNGVRTHDVHGGQGVRAKAYLPTILYVIESKPRRSLALKMNGLRTHDVHEAKWFSLRRRLFGSSPPSSMARLNVASRLAIVHRPNSPKPDVAPSAACRSALLSLSTTN